MHHAVERVRARGIESAAGAGVPHGARGHTVGSPGNSRRRTRSCECRRRWRTPRVSPAAIINVAGSNRLAGGVGPCGDRRGLLRRERRSHRDDERHPCRGQHEARHARRYAPLPRKVQPGSGSDRRTRPDRDVGAAVLLEMHRPQQALLHVAAPLGDAAGRRVAGLDQQVRADRVRLRERPLRQPAQDRGGDAAAARGRRDDVAELELAALDVDVAARARARGTCGPRPPRRIPRSSRRDGPSRSARASPRPKPGGGGSGTRVNRSTSGSRASARMSSRCRALSSPSRMSTAVGRSHGRERFVARRAELEAVRQVRHLEQPPDRPAGADDPQLLAGATRSRRRP